MAGSREPGPLQSLLEPWVVPARTPGPLGINDQGDPSVTSLLGDTPGPTGLFDAADPTMLLFTPARPASDFVCRADDRILSVGFDFKPSAAAAVPAAPSATATISLTEAQEIALKISTYFEGGKSMNYQALAGNFDGQGTSFGLIQWNFGSGTLGPLLKKMLDKDATAFAGCFGEDADYETLKTAITDGKKEDQVTWAKDLIKDHKSAWTNVFTKLGAVDAFNTIQREQAISEYHPLVETVIKKIREATTTLFVNIELRSYVAMYDLCVQQTGIDKAWTEIKKRVDDEKPTTQLELMKIVVAERARKAKTEFRADCLSRRMGILTGAAYEATESEVTSKRDNPQLSLLSGSAEKTVTGL